MSKRKYLITIFLGGIIVAVPILYGYTLKKNSLISPFATKPAAITLSQTLEQQGFSLQSPPIVQGDFLIASISGITCYFSANKDFAIQARSLQLALSRLKIKEKPKEIDLRFGKVVLRY